MKTYKFPKEQLASIMSHIASYQITILSMTPLADEYQVELDSNELPPGEYEHLNNEFNLVEVV